MRFQVPQNLDVPDTIFFGLNFKQLTYFGGAIGFTVFLYLFVGGLPAAFLFGVPVIALAALLSFFTYNNQPFSSILQSLLRFVSRKKMYVWRQSDRAVHVAGRSPDAAEKAEGNVSDPSPQGSHGPDKVGAMNADLVFDEDSYNASSSDDSHLDPVI